MFLKKITPLSQMAPFVQSFWLFQGDFGVATPINRVITPNGSVKIVLPFDNHLTAKNEWFAQQHDEHKIQLIGNADAPYHVGTTTRTSGTLILELSPQGATRFFSFHMDELTNRIVLFTDVYGKKGRQLETRLSGESDPFVKALLLQHFLIDNMNALNDRQKLVDYTVAKIIRSNGNIRIYDLEKKTGYSKRWLDRLFRQQVGLSPKTLASVSRFQYFHQLWAQNPTAGFYGNDIYDFYHDQAHFIKEFRRFSGLSPDKYAALDNEWARIFYKG